MWLLVNDSAENRVITTLRNEIEVVALAEFCKLTLAAPEQMPEHFSATQKRTAYSVTSLGAPSEKLSLVIMGPGASSTVRNIFRMPAGPSRT